MNRLQSMQVFTKVVEMNSFYRAADSLSMPRSTVSIIVRKLEAHLKVRLIQRTTRKLHLTLEGEDYYQHCVRILAEIVESEDALTNAGKGPRGRLRVDVPTSIGRAFVMPGIDDFRERFPALSVAIGFNDNPGDLIQEGVDCAICVGDPDDANLIRRRLGAVSMLTVGSPAYLRRHGVPRDIDELAEHCAVHYRPGGANASSHSFHFNFNVDGDAIEVRMKGGLSFSDVQASVICCVNGAGLVQAPGYMLKPYLQSGALVEILPAWRPRPVPIAAIYPHSRHLALKVRVFIDWVAERLERYPEMQGAQR
jgi:LysR family transcriptional regulator for bpeEF and oprC